MGNGSQTTRGAQTNYTAYNMTHRRTLWVSSLSAVKTVNVNHQRRSRFGGYRCGQRGSVEVTDAQVSQNTQSITNLNTQVLIWILA